MVKYRTAADFDKLREEQGQIFDRFKPQYFLNEVTDTLERLPQDKDIQEFIDSQKEVALNAVLDRFLNAGVTDDDSGAIADYTSGRVDLTVLGEAMEIAEDYREKNGLDDTLSYKEIYARMSEDSKTLENKLKERLSDGKKKEIEPQGE